MQMDSSVAYAPAKRVTKRVDCVGRQEGYSIVVPGSLLGGWVAAAAYCCDYEGPVLIMVQSLTRAGDSCTFLLRSKPRVLRNPRSASRSALTALGFRG